MATVVVQNSAEGLANNTTVSSANSGGASGDAWNTINTGSGNTITSDNTHVLRGTVAYKFTQAGPVSTLGWNTALPSAPYGNISARTYVYFEEMPIHDFGIITGFSGSSYSGLAWNVVLNTAGRLQLSNSSGTVLWSAPNTSVMTTGKWYRVEVNIIAGTSGSVAVYTGHDATSLAGTTLSSFSAATTSAVRFGIGNSNSISALWIDDPAVGQGGGFIGPSQSSPASTATVLAQNTAEGLTVGTTPSTANSGGTSGTAWNKVDQTGATITTDDAHILRGSVSYKITRSTSSGYLGWSGALLGAPLSDVSARAYFYYESLPTNNFALLVGYANSNFSTQAWAAVITPQGQIQLSNSSGTVLWTSPGQNTLNPSIWYRIEVHIIANTSGQIALYEGHSSSSIATTTVNTFSAATTSAVRIGTSNTTNIAALWLDDLAVGVGDLLGPSASGGVPLANAGAPQTADPGDGVTLTGSATNAPSSYQWTQISGPAVTLSGSGASRTFSAPILPSASTLVFRFSASNASGSSTPDTVSVQVAAHRYWVKKANALQPYNISTEWPKLTSSQAMTRPTGTGYYAIEDLGVGQYRGNYDLQAALDMMRPGQGFAAVPGTSIPCLTLPEGIFEREAFTRSSGYPNREDLNKNYTFFSESVAIMGSGNRTIIRTVANSMTADEASRIKPEFQPDGTRTPAATENLIPFYTIILNHNNGISGQFQVQATTQNVTKDAKYYGGLYCQSATSLILQDVLVKGFPGYLNSPPGETYNIKLWNTNNAKLYRIEADGRFPTTGVRESAIGISINSSTNTELHDCYTHHMGYSHGVVWWGCTGVKTYNHRSEYNGALGTSSAQYGIAGAGLNHEQVDDTAHYNPRLGNNSLTDIRYYSNLGRTTQPHLVDGAVITDGGNFNILLEKNQAYTAGSQTQPGITITNSPTPKFSNNQNVP